MSRPCSDGKEAAKPKSSSRYGRGNQQPGVALTGVLVWTGIAAGVLFLLFVLADNLLPVDLAPESSSRVVLARDGSLLRSFADEDGVWRYPVTLDQVSANYLDALIAYEDRWFYYHPGVNPLSLVRALFQWAANGRVVSGGSTLTMQTARLARPVPRTIAGKLAQMFTALQLEWRFSKERILTYYLNHVPFGGVVQGVQAASLAYFDHRANRMTHAEAALLAVMPQAPTRYRPDRHPAAAQKARNKLLHRLGRFRVWPSSVIAAAKKERVAGWSVETALAAPLLARRLHRQAVPSTGRIETLIDYQLQLAIEQVAADYAAGLPPRCSLAVLVMNNTTGAVEAYAGSADFFNPSRFSHVDMVTALRSPGSALKPFIYGMALDRGLIHSQSLLMDVPIQFEDFRPTNFTGRFSGPVSAAEALARSLNLPAVQLFDHLGPRFFYAGMVNAGVTVNLPPGAGPNLAMALGGCATTLEDLVAGFACLAGEGKTMAPRYQPDSPVRHHRLLSSGAAWMIYQMLLPEKKGPVRNEHPDLAVKTGTSYGYRDAWALGVDRHYTVGVWTGRPDGVPVPGHYGSRTATPLLRAVVRLLPRHPTEIPRPDSVTRGTICWPGGQRAVDGPESGKHGCETVRKAWLLEETAPWTLTRKRALPGPAVKELDLHLTLDKKFRIPPQCKADRPAVDTTVVLWPRALESWLPLSLRSDSKIPPVVPECAALPHVVLAEPVEIRGLARKEILLKKEEQGAYPVFDLTVQGGRGPWYWFENSILTVRGRTFRFAPDHAGDYQIMVMDQSGAADRIEVSVF